MLTDAAAIAAAERIKAQAGARVHRLGEPDELTEDTMPRKASTEPKPETPATKKRGRPAKAKAPPDLPPVSNAVRTRKYRIAETNPKGPRFGVFDDGSVTLALPGCKGQMVPEEARDLVAFLAKLGVKA